MTNTGAPLTPHVAPEPAALRLLRTNWLTRLERTESGAPMLDPSFVVVQGRLVEIIDIRDDDNLVGPLGHIPAVRWVPFNDIERIADVVPASAPVVLICRTGERSAIAAKRLESLGLTFVAAMTGGMVAWRNAGFSTSRDESFRERTIETLSWDPNVLAVHDTSLDKPNNHLELHEIRNHVGDARSVRWIKLAAFLLHGKISCVDGRDDHGVVGTPGGDTGELLLALAATEIVTGRPLSTATLKQIMARYIDTFGHLYLHTDISALNRFILSMRSDPRLADELPPRETLGPGWRDYMARPPAHLRELILEHLLMPEHIGCGHVRLMMQNGDEYGIREALVRSFLHEYYLLRWGGSTEAEFIVLGGGHREGAVVSVRLSEDVFPFTRVPLISPACGSRQMFVTHPDVALFLRRQLAAFMTMQKETGLVRADRDRLLERMISLGEKQINATLGRLAQGLPHYVVRFEENQSFYVV